MVLAVVDDGYCPWFLLSPTSKLSLFGAVSAEINAELRPNALEDQFRAELGTEWIK